MAKENNAGKENQGDQGCLQGTAITSFVELEETQHISIIQKKIRNCLDKIHDVLSGNAEHGGNLKVRIKQALLHLLSMHPETVMYTVCNYQDEEVKKWVEQNIIASRDEALHEASRAQGFFGESKALSILIVQQMGLLEMLQLACILPSTIDQIRYRALAIDALEQSKNSDEETLYAKVLAEVSVLTVTPEELEKKDIQIEQTYGVMALCNARQFQKYLHSTIFAIPGPAIFYAQQTRCNQLEEEIIALSEKKALFEEVLQKKCAALQKIKGLQKCLVSYYLRFFSVKEISVVLQNFIALNNKKAAPGFLRYIPLFMEHSTAPEIQDMLNSIFLIYCFMWKPAQAKTAKEPVCELDSVPYLSLPLYLLLENILTQEIWVKWVLQTYDGTNLTNIRRQLSQCFTYYPENYLRIREAKTSLLEGFRLDKLTHRQGYYGYCREGGGQCPPEPDDMEQLHTKLFSSIDACATQEELEAFYMRAKNAVWLYDRYREKDFQHNILRAVYTRMKEMRASNVSMFESKAVIALREKAIGVLRRRVVELQGTIKEMGEEKRFGCFFQSEEQLTSQVQQAKIHFLEEHIQLLKVGEYTLLELKVMLHSLFLSPLFKEDVLGASASSRDFGTRLSGGLGALIEEADTLSQEEVPSPVVAAATP